MGEEWVKEAKKGNQEALAQLLYANYEFLYKFLIKLTFNTSIAEDISQETMVRAIEKFHMYNPDKSKFSTWLIAIGQNIYMDYLRKSKRQSLYISDESIDNSELNDNPENDDRWHIALDALKRISEEVRIPIVLKHYYGYSLEEISDIMSIPVGTVKSRIHNGLKVLRKELEIVEG